MQTPQIFGMRRAAFVRVAPFAVFMVVLALRGFVPEDGSWGLDARWLYALQAGLPAVLIAWWWRDYGELARQTWLPLRELLLAVAVGALVFVLWIYLDAPWMTLGEPTASFLPLLDDGSLDWPLLLVRSAGAALLVPVMEELFWRSFLMRWIKSPLFEAVPPAQVGLKALVLATFLFVLVHTLWLAAAIAGLAYAWLYMRSGRLWSAVVAHAVSNGMLAAWVVHTGQWQFW